MTDLLSSCRNYDNYRQSYGKCAGSKIPILGVHLKDLISVNEAMPDYMDDDSSKVNVQKLQALYSHIHDLIQLQQTPPKLDVNKDLVHLLTVGQRGPGFDCGLICSYLPLSDEMHSTLPAQLVALLKSHWIKVIR